MISDLQELEVLLEKPQIREAVRSVLKHILAFLDATEPAPPPAVATVIQTPAPVPPPKRVEKDPDIVRPTVTLKGSTVGSVRVSINDNGKVTEEVRQVSTTASSDYTEFLATDNEPDLNVIAERSRLKASAIRFVMHRRARVAAGDDLREFLAEHQSFISSAKALKNCFLWMLEPWTTLPSDEYMNILAGLFDTLAFGAELVYEMHSSRHSGLSSAMNFLAEAQSALKGHLDERRDADQNDAFKWLRKTALDIGIFIPRYMKVDEIADATQWQDLQSRILRTKESIGLQKKEADERKRLLSKVKYHCKRVLSGATADDWNKITESIETLVMYGI